MSIKNLLDFIAKPESGGDYNVVWGKIRPAHRSRIPLTKMTIGQVLAWQDSIDALYMSEASGRYQIMEDTLRGLYRQAGLSATDLYDERNQDRLALQLLKRRGLDRYLSGVIDYKQFAQKLSMEWASLPAVTIDRNGRPATGQSYYAGDGLNKSHVSISSFLGVVRALNVATTQSPKSPARHVGFWAWLRFLFTGKV